MRVSYLARYLHAWSISYCADVLTDGEILAAALPPGIPRKAVNELVSTGLWESPTRGVYRLHDYLDYNPSRDQVAALRQADAARKAAAREAVSRSKNGQFAPIVRPDSSATPGGFQAAS